VTYVTAPERNERFMKARSNERNENYENYESQE